MTARNTKSDNRRQKPQNTAALHHCHPYHQTNCQEKTEEEENKCPAFYGQTPEHTDKWSAHCTKKNKCTRTQWHLTDGQEQKIRRPSLNAAKCCRLKPLPNHWTNHTAEPRMKERRAPHSTIQHPRRWTIGPYNAKSKRSMQEHSGTWPMAKNMKSGAHHKDIKTPPP